MSKRFVVGAVVLLSGLFATPAFADGAASADGTVADSPSTKLQPATVSLLAGHGFNESFGTGFGARIGYTLPNKIHLGASFAYHLGTTHEMIESNVWYAGGEVGYDISAGPLIIRPYAGVGSVSASATVTLPATASSGGGKITASESRIAFWPGAEFLFPFEDGCAFVGVDARFVVVDQANAFNTYATFGLAF